MGSVNGAELTARCFGVMGMEGRGEGVHHQREETSFDEEEDAAAVTEHQ